MNYFSYLNKGFNLIALYYKAKTWEEKKKVTALMESYYNERDLVDTSLINNEINNIMGSIFKLYHLFFLVKGDPVAELEIADIIYESLLEVKSYIKESSHILDNDIALLDSELEKTLSTIKP